MLMNQFPPEDFHLILLRIFGFSKVTTSVLVLGPISEGHVLSSLQAEKHTMSIAPGIESVSHFVVEAILHEPSEFNWRDYYSQTLTTLMSTTDEAPQGE
jgi:hypothetical protein